MCLIIAYVKKLVQGLKQFGDKADILRTVMLRVENII